MFNRKFLGYIGVNDSGWTLIRLYSLSFWSFSKLIPLANVICEETDIIVSLRLGFQMFHLNLLQLPFLLDAEVHYHRSWRHIEWVDLSFFEDWLDSMKMRSLSASAARLVPW